MVMFEATQWVTGRECICFYFILIFRLFNAAVSTVGVIQYCFGWDGDHEWGIKGSDCGLFQGTAFALDW
jgi:hypothetical protein